MTNMSFVWVANLIKVVHTESLYYAFMNLVFLHYAKLKNMNNYLTDMFAMAGADIRPVAGTEKTEFCDSFTKKVNIE